MTDHRFVRMKMKSESCFMSSLYAIGGVSFRDEECSMVERFQPGFETVHVCQPLSAKRRHPGIGNLDGQLYCVGGSANETWTDSAERLGHRIIKDMQ